LPYEFPLEEKGSTPKLTTEGRTRQNVGALEGELTVQEVLRKDIESKREKQRRQAT
jgi:hypothetical protein